MTKKEIVRCISDNIGLPQMRAKEIVQKVFEAILQALLEEGRVELRNFGVFEVKRRKARMARNPRTGERVFVPEKLVVTFKPGQIMQQRIEALGNGSSAAGETADQSVEAKPSIPFDRSNNEPH